MDPNVYFAYLCLTDNHSSVKHVFDNWRKAPPSVREWNVYESRLEMEISKVCWSQVEKYRRLYIFEAEQAWKETNAKTLIWFLKGLGFKK